MLLIENNLVTRTQNKKQRYESTKFQLYNFYYQM